MAVDAAHLRGNAIAVVVGGDRLAQLALGAVALHVLDDNFLQPNPGVPPAKHLAGGIALLAAVAVAAVLQARGRAGVRGSAALVGGWLGLVVGSEAAYYTLSGSPSSDDFTGLLALAAGFVLLGAGARTLWSSRRRDSLRHARRFCIAVGVFVLFTVVMFPMSVSYVLTHTARADVPAAHLGAAHENVEFTTADGLTLKGWYVASRNGAAVIAYPGRAASTQKRAAMLIRHGYGVLLFDRRGEGASDGDPNVYGWQGARDVRAAAAYLRERSGVERVGAIGMSVGGEVLLEAAARSNDLHAIVSEGASGRSVRDDFANPDTSWDDTLGDLFATAGTALFSSTLPPPDLRGLVPTIAAPTFFIYGQHGQPAERAANRAFYAAARAPAELWEVPGSGHIGGPEARPHEYERRVVGFFDRHLVNRKETT